MSAHIPHKCTVSIKLYSKGKPSALKINDAFRLRLSFAQMQEHKLGQIHNNNNTQQSSKVQPQSCLGSRFQYLR